jgi:prepilin-type N-terminal cleavage/methylation domain-containing protein
MTQRVRAVLGRLAGQRGLTLPEMLIVLMILGVVIGGMTQLFTSASVAEVELAQRFQAQQNARLALDSLKREIHNATGPSTFAVPDSSLTIYLGAGSTNPVTWCALGSSSRYSLWRAPAAISCTPSVDGSSCISTNCVQKADYLTTDMIFTDFAPCGSGLRAKLSVALPVDTKPATASGRYELADDIVLRNTSRTC